MKLEVFSDVACPWCFIGKRKLFAAMQKLPEAERPEVVFRAYQLAPDFPKDKSEPALAYLQRRFAGRPLEPMLAHVAAAGRSVGIDFAFGQQRACNTLLSHQAIAIAQAHGQGAAVVEALFSAHFEKGLDLSDRAVVAQVLEAFGIADAQAKLERGEGKASVADDIQRAHAYGCQGVPLFVLDETYGLSGAQDESVFVHFLSQSAGDKP